MGAHGKVLGNVTVGVIRTWDMRSDSKRRPTIVNLIGIIIGIIELALDWSKSIEWSIGNAIGIHIGMLIRVRRGNALVNKGSNLQEDEEPARRVFENWSDSCRDWG